MRHFLQKKYQKKIATLIKPKDLKAEFELIFQELEGLHRASPMHLGDWYFSGNYPTPGGNKVSNQAFVNFIEGNNKRAY